MPPLNIGPRLELFVDDYLIEKQRRVQQRLNQPTPREIALEFDKPWEGNTSCYYRVFKDGDIYRLYYRGGSYDRKTLKAGDQFVCYAESRDGVKWQRPALDIHPYRRHKKTNILHSGPGAHNFSPFKDNNPRCKKDAKYKAIGSHRKGLVAFKSKDGLHWSLMQDEPVITDGAFDSQNLAFWDDERGCYVDFHRDFRRVRGKGVRDIKTCTSKDFLNWTKPQWLDFGKTPPEHLYTNAITPYPRAPHILMGFPKRFLPSRSVVDADMNGVSDGVYMTSRDGLHWDRWREAFIRPGLQSDRWYNRNNMTAWGMLILPSTIPNTPDEISLYSSEGYYSPGVCRLRRYTLRQDGFVSMHADARGGEVLTKALKFEGKQLQINYSTSAAGSVRVELQGNNGKPIKGFSLDDCEPIYGDAIGQKVRWSKQKDLSSLAGKAIRIRFMLEDADLYSLQFVKR